MPTYEYTCEKCGHHFEVVQSISEKPLKSCPKTACPRKTWGKGKVRRAISGGAGLLFKGSGFYITDYRSEGYKAAARKESAPAAAGGETKAPAKSDSSGASKGAAPSSAAKRSGA